MSSDAHRSLLGDSASESAASVGSGLSDASASRCGGGAGCSGCEPRLAIRVVAMGKGEDDEDDLDADESPRARSGSGGNRQRRSQRVHGRAVLHAGGGFSFREDREGGEVRMKSWKQACFFCLAVFAFLFTPNFFVFLKNLLSKNENKKKTAPPLHDLKPLRPMLLLALRRRRRRRKRCGGEGKIERLLLRGRGLGPRRRPPGPAAAPALLDLDLGLGRGSRFFSFSFPLLLPRFRALFGL